MIDFFSAAVASCIEDDVLVIGFGDDPCRRLAGDIATLCAGSDIALSVQAP